MKTPHAEPRHKDSGTCFAPHPTETFTNPYEMTETPALVPVYCSSPIDAGQHRYSHHVGLGSKLNRVRWDR